jgi:drug/metabolite transporter (DMT)-like permease
VRIERRVVGARIVATVLSLQPATKAHVQIHVCVALWGFTTILGKLITLAAPALVLWRMMIVVTALSLLPRVWRGWFRLPRRLLVSYALTGGIVAAHWLTFYTSIKLANASVAATSLALAPVFLAIIEPLVRRSPFDARELVLGVAVVPGVALVVGGTPAGMRLGFLVGTLSALLAAAFNVSNKRLVGRADPLTVTHIEIACGTVILAVALPWLSRTRPLLPIPSTHDALLLVVLALACTVLPFTLALIALEHLTAFSSQLAVNLEPVYAVLLAILLLGEQHQLGPSFYAGVVIVIGAVFAHPLMSRVGKR